MMELFTLGADRGYTERDVREQARALTGWSATGSTTRPFFHYDRKRHDTATKTVFGKAGNYDWRDACELCLQNPHHATYFVRKLWSYFIPTTPNAKTERALVLHLHAAAEQVRPVVEAILKHPTLYTGPRMVKPPIVYIGRPAARARPAGRHVVVGAGSPTSPGSASSTRPTSPAGTTAAGSTPPRSAAAGTSSTYA